MLEASKFKPMLGWDQLLNTLGGTGIKSFRKFLYQLGTYIGLFFSNFHSSLGFVVTESKEMF
jgi:hypothetical protein